MPTGNEGTGMGADLEQGAVLVRKPLRARAGRSQAREAEMSRGQSRLGGGRGEAGRGRGHA